MPINFPNSPSNGQEYASGSTTWVYDGTKWNLKSTAATTNDSMPIGSIMWFAGSSSPPGWIPANGDAVSRTTYATLFATIGTTYGVGDGSTTFNVPSVASTTGAYYIRYTTSLGTVTTTSLATSPVGTMLDWPTTSSYPTGYLRADGSPVSRVSYADLFSLIGTTYGTGDGSTTFNLPNLVAAGSGSPVKIIKATLGGIVEPSTVSHAASHTEGGSDVVSVTLNQVPNYQSMRNKIINGNFDVWQRGTSPTGGSTANTTYFAADRWAVLFDGTMGTYTLPQQSFTLGQTDVPGEPKYFMRWSVTTAGSGSTYRYIVQRIEDVRTFANQTVTLSFWMKAAANSTVTPMVRQNFGTGGSPSGNVDTSATACSVTTSWQKFTRTFTVPSISGKTLGTTVDTHYLQLQFACPLNATMTIDLAQVQLEAGSVATPFEFEPFEATLRKCQRYYCKSFANNVAPTAGAGSAASGGNDLQVWNITLSNSYLPFRKFPVEMRATPVVTTINAENATANTWSFYNSSARAGDFNPGLTSNNRGFFGSISGSYTVTNGAWTASAEL